MPRIIATAAIALAMLGGRALADPAEGIYQMPSGYNAKVAPCGSQLCLTYVNGPYDGRTFGTFRYTGNGSYAGTITDYPNGGKTYKGKARLVGRDIGVSGCVLFGLICREEVFKRQ